MVRSQGVVVSSCPLRVFCTHRKGDYSLPSTSNVSIGQWVDLKWSDSLGAGIAMCRPATTNIPVISASKEGVKVRTLVVLPSETEASQLPDGIHMAWSPLLGTICVHGSFGEQFDAEKHSTDAVYELACFWQPEFSPSISSWIVVEQPIRGTNEDYWAAARGAPWMKLVPECDGERQRMDEMTDRQAQASRVHSQRQPVESASTVPPEVYVGCVIGQRGRLLFVWAAGQCCISFEEEHPNGHPALGQTIHLTLKRLDNAIAEGCVYAMSEWQCVEQWTGPSHSIALGHTSRDGENKVTVRVCVLNRPSRERLGSREVSVFSHSFFGSVVDDGNATAAYKYLPAFRVRIKRRRYDNVRCWQLVEVLGSARAEDVDTASVHPVTLQEKEDTPQQQRPPVVGETEKREQRSTRAAKYARACGVVVSEQTRSSQAEQEYWQKAEKELAAIGGQFGVARAVDGEGAGRAAAGLALLAEAVAVDEVRSAMHKAGLLHRALQCINCHK